MNHSEKKKKTNLKCLVCAMHYSSIPVKAVSSPWTI